MRTKNFVFSTACNGFCGFGAVKKGIISVWQQSSQISKFNIQPGKGVVKLSKCQTELASELDRALGEL